MMYDSESASGIAEKQQIALDSPSRRIESDLRRRVETAQWLPGQALPSRRDLARDYGVDLRTVQKAISGLLSDGTLRADGPRGTFVAMASPVSPVSSAQSTVVADRKVLKIGVIWKGALEESETEDRNLFTPLIISVERALSARNAMSRPLDLSDPSMSGLSAAEGVAMLDKQGVDGIISVIDRAPRELALLVDTASARRIPLVHAAGEISRLPRLCVYYSNTEAGFQTASNLISRGCASLFFFSAFRARWVDDRLRGVFEAAQAYELTSAAVGQSIGVADIYSLLDSPTSRATLQKLTYEAAKGVLKQGLPAEGIVASNDLNAYGFMQAASEMGFTAGKDYAIIGVDDSPKSAMLGLSTLRTPLETMGREAVGMLFREIEQPGLAMRTCLPSDLISRGSTMTFEGSLAPRS
ncbi:MAG TPA: substrate-binding domain-containing protein [Capsulimonadaceae bacterium]|jgi:DNA-binding LacI/PurR family transcriptional regulator